MKYLTKEQLIVILKRPTNDRMRTLQNAALSVDRGLVMMSDDAPIPIINILYDNPNIKAYQNRIHCEIFWIGIPVEFWIVMQIAEFETLSSTP